MYTIKSISQILTKLSKSKFRSSFELNREDVDYINKIGFSKIELHARDFVKNRLAPKNPKNDGKQTPFKGHPVFKAQHATASCCRNCLKKWYNISDNRSLKINEIDFIVNIIIEWIKKGLK